MTTITYTRNNTWQLLDANGASELTESGIEGMIGDYRDTSTQTPGIPGQQVTAQDVSPMEGTLKAFIEGDESRNAGEVWAAFRADFATSTPESSLSPPVTGHTPPRSTSTEQSPSEITTQKKKTFSK